ncbi:MAG: hypothetical protein ACR2L3_01285 [Actinomycetota bacterium]
MLGLSEWLVIIGLAAGLIMTFRVMARAAGAYAKAREQRAKQALVDASLNLGTDPLPRREGQEPEGETR